MEQPQGWLSTTFNNGALLHKLAQGPQGRGCSSVIPCAAPVGILSSTRNTDGLQNSWPSLQLPLTFHHRSCRNGRLPTPQQKWLLQPLQATPHSSVCTVWGTGYINNSRWLQVCCKMKRKLLYINQMQIYYLKLFHLNGVIKWWTIFFSQYTLSKEDQTVKFFYDELYTQIFQLQIFYMSNICETVGDCKLDSYFSHLSAGKSQRLITRKILHCLYLD